MTKCDNRISMQLSKESSHRSLRFASGPGQHLRLRRKNLENLEIPASPRHQWVLLLRYASVSDGLLTPVRQAAPCERLQTYLPRLPLS